MYDIFSIVSLFILWCVIYHLLFRLHSRACEICPRIYMPPNRLSKARFNHNECLVKHKMEFEQFRMCYDWVKGKIESLLLGFFNEKKHTFSFGFWCNGLMQCNHRNVEKSLFKKLLLRKGHEIISICMCSHHSNR